METKLNELQDELKLSDQGIGQVDMCITRVTSVFGKRLLGTDHDVSPQIWPNVEGLCKSITWNEQQRMS